MAIFPEHPQDLTIYIIVADMLQEPLNSFPVTKIRNLTLQADEIRQRALRNMLFEIVIRTKDNLAELSIYTLQAHISNSVL